MPVDKRIKEWFNLTYNFVDFFYAFCNAKGIDDPEEELNDDEYARLEEECEKILTTSFLDTLRRNCEQEINDRIAMAMEEAAHQ